MEHAQDKGIPNIRAEASASISAKTPVTFYVTKKDDKLREVEVAKEQSIFAKTVDGETIEDVDKGEKIVKVWDVTDQGATQIEATRAMNKDMHNVQAQTSLLDMTSDLLVLWKQNFYLKVRSKTKIV